jgi:hypothetical protein
VAGHGDVASGTGTRPRALNAEPRSSLSTYERSTRQREPVVRLIERHEYGGLVVVGLAAWPAPKSASSVRTVPSSAAWAKWARAAVELPGASAASWPARMATRARLRSSLCPVKATKTYERDSSTGLAPEPRKVADAHESDRDRQVLESFSPGARELTGCLPTDTRVEDVRSRRGPGADRGGHRTVNGQVRLGGADESAGTPGSVTGAPRGTAPAGGHPSRPAVAGRLERSTRRLGRAVLERLRRAAVSRRPS